MDFSRIRASEKMRELLWESLEGGHWHGRGPYTKEVERLLSERLNASVWMTTSCTHALELALRLCHLADGDEVILPSYAFPSVANAVLMANGTIRYAPIEPVTGCLDVDALPGLVTERTKAVLVVHYGGQSHQIRELATFCRQNHLFLIEDAAQAFGSTVDGRALGTFGDFSAISFHGTKNVGCGEGGALVIRQPDSQQREMIESYLEKGTNRLSFERQQVSHYEWTSLGSSLVPSDLLMALLYGGLQEFDENNALRKNIYERYVRYFQENSFSGLERFSGQIESETTHNAHLFWLVWKDAFLAQKFIDLMRERNIPCYPHFYPLHLSKMGKRFRLGHEDLWYEEQIKDTLVRLPLFSSMSQSEVDMVFVALEEVREDFYG